MDTRGFEGSNFDGIRCWYRPFRMEVNPVKCLMCGVNYHSESDRLQHLQGKRHKSNFDKDLGVFHKSVEVRWESKWLENKVLMDYFSKFGEIEKCYFNTGKNYAFIYYNKSGIVHNILQKEDHSVNGISIKIKKRASIQPPRTAANKVKRQVNENNEYKYKNDRSELMTKLRTIETMSEQMRAIKETLRLSPSQLRERESVANSLTELFRPYIPACTVHVFGSSANGFGMKGGDIDLFLDLNEDKINQASQVVARPPRSLLSRLSSKANNSKLFNFYDLTLKDQIIFTGNVLRSNRSISQNILCISMARCPVVKFKHVLSGLDCDISINNRIALRNTKLLTLYGNLDERVKDLVFTVRYWAKIHQLAGNSIQEMSSYALTSLVIFFLQNTEPPVLPTLQTLKSLTDERIIIDNWDCSFTDDISVIPKTTNTDTAGQLFKKFLDFHKKILFNKMILKCNLATIIPIKDSSEQLETNSSVKSLKTFRFAEMNVQDPFVLSHNLTLNVKPEKKNWFKMRLNHSSAEMKKCLDLNQENMALICALDPSRSTSVNIDTNLYTFPIHLQQEVTFNDNIQMSSYLWCVHACQFIETLLSDILHIELTVEQNIMSEKDFQLLTHNNAKVDNEGELPDTEQGTKMASSEISVDLYKRYTRHFKPILLDPKERDKEGELTDSKKKTNMASIEVLADFDEKQATNLALGETVTFASQVLADFDEISDKQNNPDFDEKRDEHNIIKEQAMILALGETGTFASQVLADFDDEISDKQKNLEEHNIGRFTNIEQETNVASSGSGTFASQVVADFDNEISDKQTIKRELLESEEHSAKRTKTDTVTINSEGEILTPQDNISTVMSSEILTPQDNISTVMSSEILTPQDNISTVMSSEILTPEDNISTVMSSEILTPQDNISTVMSSEILTPQDNISTIMSSEILTPQDNISTIMSSEILTPQENISTIMSSEILTPQDNISTVMSSEIDSIDLGEIVFHCHAENVPLTGRQKIGKEIQMEQVIQDLALEKEISKRIIERGDHKQIKSDFKCILKSSISESHTRVTVSFEETTNPKSNQFNFLFDFLKPFILKMFKKDVYNACETEKSDDKIGGERS